MQKMHGKIHWINRKLRIRIQQHKSDIKNRRNTSIAQHFNRENHTEKDLHIGVILNCQGEDRQRRLQLEAIAIQIFDTIENGMNDRDKRNLNLKPTTWYSMEHFLHSTTCWPFLIHHAVNITAIK